MKLFLAQIIIDIAISLLVPDSLAQWILGKILYELSQWPFQLWF